MLGMYLLDILLVALAGFGVGWLYFLLKTGVPTFPTMPPMRNKMIEILQREAQTRAGKLFTIVDLGSGSGQLSRAIAKAMPKAQVIGIELSLIPWLRAVVRQKILGPSNLEYKRTDFWIYDIGHADAVITYLMEFLMPRVSEKLQKELKPGALVAASKFKLHGSWIPFEEHQIGLPLPMTLRLYRQPSAANRNDPEDGQSQSDGAPEILQFSRINS